MHGVLTFSYRNVKNFRQSMEGHGFFSMNLGDYMQTLAIRRLYRSLGITETVDVDRDSLATYSGPPVTLVMNGVFFPWSFPIPETVTPVFVGFHAGEKVVKANLAYFKKHAPIGCRDSDTTELFQRYGVEAFTTGCLTMTFEAREPIEGGVPLIVVGGGAGSFPVEVLRHMPPDMAQAAPIVHQRKIVHSFPLGEQDMKDAERYAHYLLDDYRSRASVVITPLHHATTPCLSSGIPVIVCRKEANTRFSWLEKRMPVYTPERFAEIDWSAPLADLSRERDELLATAKRLLQ
jgi:hypothetical protein